MSQQYYELRAATVPQLPEIDRAVLLTGAEDDLSYEPLLGGMRDRPRRVILIARATAA